MDNLSPLPIPSASFAAVNREQASAFVQGASALLRKQALELISIPANKSVFWGGVASAALGAVLAGVAMRKMSAAKRWLAGGGAVGASYVATNLMQGQIEGEKQLKAMASETMMFVDRFDRDNALQQEFLDYAQRGISSSHLAQEKELKELAATGLLAQFGLEKKLLSPDNKFAFTLAMSGSAMNSIQSFVLAHAQENRNEALMR